MVPSHTRVEAAVRVELAVASLGLDARALGAHMLALAPEVAAYLALRVRSGFDWAALVTRGVCGDRDFAERLRGLARELGQPLPFGLSDLPVRPGTVTVQVGMSQGGIAALGLERTSTSTLALELEPLTHGPDAALTPSSASRLVDLGLRLGGGCAAIAEVAGSTSRAVQVAVPVAASRQRDIDAVLAAADVTRPQRDYFADTFAYLAMGRPVLVRFAGERDQLQREVRVEYAGVVAGDVVKVMTTFEGAKVGGPLGGIVGTLGVEQGTLELAFRDHGAPGVTVTFDPGAP